MDYKFLAVFFALSMVNVVFATIKSLVTINGSPAIASLVSGGYFAFYNIVMQYTVADFPMWQKCLITFVCNVVGVYCVKYGEKKSRKDRLWKVEATFKHDDNLIAELKEWAKVNDIGFKYNDIIKYYEIDFYSHTQAESVIIKNFIEKHDGKYFVSESKTL